MKNIFKSLKALAGDNDRIFVILDDRDDIWLVKNNLDDENYGTIPDNLLKIPGYFFHDIPNLTSKFKGFQKLYFDLAKLSDLDLTLLTFKKFLL